ncbi:IscS subfamily cysteine desulfurase [Aliikangiella coralliicola]|uniref:cysteine desulfurase n=1 Tax=Aliikangiella coralliicola TaxID=2592383 RepID=A0A545UAG0_9GAMM|nr:IscS subfamily cysteine desulfurase [Aliikangiella coralliicola]TQV86457.1 IscS subfamily cysteine desulfurase [Aliikangiella coralliicola]
MRKVIYLDYAATTPVDPRVADKMMACLTPDGFFGNPASRSHRYGWQAEELVDVARNQVAELIGADPREIIWTSGATEADNLAIKGIAAWQKKGHIITSAIEHKAVLDTCEYLQTQGFEVTYLPPDKNGVIQPDAVAEAIREDTILVSIMHVNNELGTIQDIQRIGEIAHAKNIPFHVDAAQSAGKIPIDLTELPVDYMSFCAHKIYGPKGIGALFARRNQQPHIEAQIHGGGHERGLRSGTLPTHQIAGMGLAFELAREELAAEAAKIKKLKLKFWEAIEPLGDIGINGDIQQTVAGILNIRFDYVDSETLLMAFKDIAVSSGSACTSASVEPSFVLKALGLNDEQAHSSLRFSFGRFTTEEEIEKAAQVVRHGVERLRSMSPEWLEKKS